MGSPNMDAKQRSEAKESGLTKYNTGKPCKHGHFSDRWTRDGKCCECTHIYDRARLKTVSKTPRWKAAQARARIRRKVEAISHYGGCCACCGITRLEFLCLDHIENNGGNHRREIGRQPMARWLKASGWPEGYQVLCWNCNAAKQILGGCRCQDQAVA